jgi:serine/threonine protein kinase
MIGKSLAHYEIISQLGKGGMGEVYQAKDRKLGRDVAIKVLPEEFARDADRVARFQREAKVLASLNHPNIAAIHGLEESQGANFLVLELIEGQTLADRIKAAPIPVEESLKLALQIAEALEAAHEKGVIHRDLKPANIKVTPDGKVKVLDFGLAKAYAGDKEEVNLSNSPTLSDAATQQGVILGTAAYMSPEQAKGKSVDKKADIWAFGCVLYEMLTGRAAFRGDDVSEILASVIKGDMKLDLLPANLHPRVREVITRCLQKDLKKRYSGITDARYEIEQALVDSGGVLVQPIIAAEPREKSRTMLWIAVAVVLTAIVVGLAIWKLKPSEPRQVMRFEYDLPEDQQLSGLAVSPDGKQFLYSTPKGLYVRSLGQLAAQLISGTEGNNADPFYSPDGQWIGYFSVADKKLKKISINGGVPVPLCDIANYLGANWGADDIIAYAEGGKGIMQVSANGGTPEVVLKPKSGILAFVAPQLLPDGESVLYTAIASNNQPAIVIQSLKSGEAKELFAGAMARYLQTGHIVYGLANANSIFAAPFDLDKRKVTGNPVAIMENISAGAVSDSGTLVYVTASQIANATAPARTLVWVDREGKEEALPMTPDNYKWPTISPDGKRVAVTKSPSTSDQQIWIWDLVRETMTRLTFDKAPSYRPIWTRDGKRIVFISRRDGKFGIYWKAADGTDEDQMLVFAPTPATMLDPWSWSSDGKTLAIDQIELTSNPAHSDIGTLSMEGDHTIKLLLHAEYNQVHPNISPDGKYIAYMSAESGKGQMEIYVRPFPEVNKGKFQISTSGGESPLWSPDGRELFYRSKGAVMAVSIDNKSTFTPGRPGMLFQGPYATGYQESPAWDISPDGKRFVMIKQPAASAASSTAAGPRKINIIVNWFEELKQRVPVK